MSDESLQPLLRDLALKLLARRDYSALELSAKLKQKIHARRRHFPQGSAVGAIDTVIKYLTHEGYLDDRRYALALAQRWRSKRLYGDARIQRDLKRRGIDAKIVVSVLSEISDCAGALRKAAEGYVERRGIPSSRADLQHFYRHLIRLGHAQAEVRQCLSPFFRKLPAVSDK